MANEFGVGEGDTKLSPWQSERRTSQTLRSSSFGEPKEGAKKYSTGRNGGEKMKSGIISLQ